MRAGVVERPGVLMVREVAPPEMGEYDALCELLYGATCSGTDNHVLAGRAAWTTVNYPTVLGHESIGRVIRLGAKVRNFKLGDLVTRVGTRPAGGVSINWGGFAEYGLATDHQAMREDGLPRSTWDRYRINQTLPPGTDPAAATMMITWRETLSYVSRIGIGPSARVLVIGSGGNGLSFVSHSANLGSACVVMLGSAERAGRARRAGATGYVDYHQADAGKQLAKLAEEACGGFDFVIDAVGRSGTLDLGLPHVATDATVGIYGMDSFGRYSLNPQLTKHTFAVYQGGYDEPETHARVLEFWQAGKLKPEIWLDMEHPYELGQLGQALEDVEQRKLVKALVRLSKPS
jgi:D-arabinose 1-dehydrogenase-like Zn-dependent alcohol dehydrogenase